MELTKVEKILALSGCVNALGVDATKELLGEETLMELDKLSIETFENTTLKELTDSGVSMIEKLTNSILSVEG